MVPFDNIGNHLFRILSDLHALAHSAATAMRSVSQDHYPDLFQAIQETAIVCEQGIDSVMMSLGARDMQAAVRPAELMSSMPIALPHNVSDPTGVKVSMRAAHEALAVKWAEFAEIAPAAEAMASRAFAEEHTALVDLLGTHNGSPRIE
jgi:hypothetical protein